MPSPQQQIIALGGGGFSMEPDNLRLDQYILAQARLAFPEADRIKVCFVGTASGDAESYQLKFYRAMAELNVQASHLSLFKPPVGKSVRDFVFEHHVIYVGGGNTRAMLALWREWQLDVTLRDAYSDGIFLAGISVGAICWFEQGLSDSVNPGLLEPLDCLGFLPGSFCPHFDGEPLRRPRYHETVSNGSIRPGIAANDGAAVHYVNGKLHRVIASRPNAKAYRVERRGESCTETILETIGDEPDGR